MSVDSRRLQDLAYERSERNRPRPTYELSALKNLAHRANEGDASASLEFSVACTPQTFILALAAARYDETHPIYDCYGCHDGKDLPEGYVCRACGTEN